MKRYLVILSFLLAYLISHAEDPLLPGGLNVDKFYKAPFTESKYFFAEKPDTDFTWYTAVADHSATDTPVTYAPATVVSEKKSIRMYRVQILHLDLPPPAIS